MSRRRTLADIVAERQREALHRPMPALQAPPVVALPPRVDARIIGGYRRVSAAELLAARRASQRRRRPTPESWLMPPVYKSAGGDLSLYPFQLYALSWLRDYPHRLLADEMGLGKTIELVCALDSTHGTLVVCPASLGKVWERAVFDWRPDLEWSRVRTSTDRWRPERGEVRIATYDQLAQLYEDGDEWLFPDLDFSHVTLIGDEIQYLKGGKTHRTIAWRKLAAQCGRVWGATGTPMLNDPLDLWGVLLSAQVAWMAFGSYDDYIEAWGGVRRHWGGVDFPPLPPDPEEIKLALSKVMLRRLRKDVLPDLPSKIYQDVFVNVDDELSDECDRVLERWDHDTQSYELPEGPSYELPSFREFSQARARLASAKVSAALEIVEKYETARTPLLVFSCHKDPIYQIGCREGWGCITGDTDRVARMALVDAFQAGLLCGLALTTKTGGVGLTLTRASTSLFLDLDPVPSVNEQAEDRTPRIGQKAEKVTIIRLIADHPLDARIVEINDYKSRQIGSVL